MTAVSRTLVNAARSLRSLRGAFGVPPKISTKHDFEQDFGYKEQLEFDDLYYMYKRNSAANSLVVKTHAKTWETIPTLRSGADRATEMEPNDEEKAIDKHFQKIRFWQKLAMADTRGMVGDYAGVILQVADGKRFSEPLEKGSAKGIKSLYNIIPAWQGQLEVSEWDKDETSETFGEPLMMTYTESSVDPQQGKERSFIVHPSRVYIWSQDRTTFNDSKMEAVYNALLDMAKIRGAGGEGFWKNAKSQPYIRFDPEVNINELKAALGVETEAEIADALDKVVDDWAKGFDNSLMLQGGDIGTLQTQLPQPKQFYEIAAREVAATWGIPEKIWFGNQTGERSSTEDANNWNKFNMSRRYNYVVPNIMDILAMLVHVGVLNEKDWALYWEDLTGATKKERMEEASSMSQINKDHGLTVFSFNEIRRATNRPDASDADLVPLSGGPEEDEEEQTDGEETEDEEGQPELESGSEDSGERSEPGEQ